MANLRMESAMKVSVSEKCVIGVGGWTERSSGSGGVSGEAKCERVVVRGRRLLPSQ